jgi:SAM-dependent methyltransferase
MGPKSEVEARELAYHEKLYSGFAQKHFAKPAVRALRRHMVERICRVTGANAGSRVLSLGCGIGDTELLLAHRVKSLVGVDLSPAAIRQARADALSQGVGNIDFVEGAIDSVRGEFDVIVAIFFLHHLPDPELKALPVIIRNLLEPGGHFYSLDPSCHRLSGAIGSLLVPGLMKKYQTEDERELDPAWTSSIFTAQGFQARLDYYDFVSSPLAGLFPSWAWGYNVARASDELLRRIPLLRNFGSNFEIIAQRPSLIDV